MSLDSTENPDLISRMGSAAEPRLGYHAGMQPVEVLHEGKHLRFVRRGHWEFIQRPRIKGIVGIVAVTDDRKLVLVEQYRAPVDRTVIELPAGLAGDIAGNEHEALAEAARRELEEETGYRAAEMMEVAAGASSAGLCDEIITLFLAKGLTRVGEGGGDATEDITVHEIPLEQVPSYLSERLRCGAQVDLKVYAALHFVW